MSSTQRRSELARPPRAAILDFTAWSPRTAAVVAGIALAVMAVLAGWGNLGAIAPLVTHGDAARTAESVSRSGLQFSAGIACLGVAAVLDIVVAGALYTLFRTVNRTVSAVAGWTRVVYAGIFLVAIGQLVAALSLVDSPDRAMRALDAFTTIWVTGLGVFGVHLVLVGCLAFRSGFVARVFGVLLAVAGVGYLADAVGTVVVAEFTAVFAQFLFVGEVAFIFWLLIRGPRLPAVATSSPSFQRDCFQRD